MQGRRGRCNACLQEMLQVKAIALPEEVGRQENSKSEPERRPCPALSSESGYLPALPPLGLPQ